MRMGRVTVSAQVALERWTAGDLGVTLRLAAQDGHVQEARAALAGQTHETTLELEVLRTSALVA